MPNPKWWGPPVHLSRLVFQVITDPTDELTALQNGEVQAINPQPQVDMLNSVRGMSNVNYQLSSACKPRTSSSTSTTRR